MILPIVFFYLAYGGVSYAGILIKGWNVTVSDWFNPLAGFSWGNDPGCIPDTQVLPGKTGGPCNGAASSGGGGCGSLSDTLVTPFGEVKLAECLAGKASDEVTNIIKDLTAGGGSVAASLPGPANEIVPGTSALVNWLKGLF